MPSSSGMWVPAHLILDAAKATIFEINNERERKFEEIVCRFMQTRRYVFFGPMLTRKEAERQAFSTTEGVIALIYREDAKRKAERLIPLADEAVNMLNGSQIYVTSDDFQAIHKHFNRRSI